MQDRFDYETFWQILDRVRETHRIVRFADVRDRVPDEPFAILRHDVDYSTDAALRMAADESARGVRATYFLLLNGAYYNVFDPRHASVPARLVALGHEVGLHYDVTFLRQFPRTRWRELMRLQAAVLEGLSGEPVVSIAMHQPGIHGDDPLRGQPEFDFVNAYDDRFVRDATYLSDSCRAWRDAAWELLTRGPLPRAIQLALHPLNWNVHDRDRVAIFQDLHVGLAREIESAGCELLDKIERHQSVIEHEARQRGRHRSEDRRP
jgi:hypothetical protein